MKLLTNRVEISTTINFRKMPVIHIDLADADDCCLRSKPVWIDTGRHFSDGEKMWIKAELNAYCDETKFKFTQGGAMLHDDFGYSGIVELLDYSNAPVVKADEDVLIIITDSRTKKAVTPFILHTDKCVDSNCMVPLKFVDADYDTKKFLKMAGIEQELR